MSVDDFRSFNPQATKPVLLAAATPQLLLPYDQASTFVTNLARHEGPLSSWTAWVVPKTMNPAEAAKRVGMSEAELRDINRIPPRMLVKGGSTLLVPRGAHVTDDVAERVADAAALNLTPDAPPLRKVAFKAGKSDSVGAVAARYKLKPEQVASWNKVAASARFKPGQMVVVYTPNKPATAPVKPTAKVAKDRVRRDVNT
jgi:membrane-bound lytic murein transglycosylase D